MTRRFATIKLASAMAVIAWCAADALAVGQSAVITLVFPSGARSLAMGEVGTALADDEQAAFYNPAGLGIQNSRWHGGAFTNSYEQLLPAFNMPDLWHGHLAGLYQPPIPSVGGFAADFNYINFGASPATSGQGQAMEQLAAYEWVLALAWGFNFEEFGLKNHFFGVSFKFINSVLAPGYGPGGQGTATDFAFDAGYIWRFLPCMRVGLTLANMGPSVYYISQSQSDPIPFTVNLALAYKNSFSVGNFHLLDVNAEIRGDREIVKNYPDKQPDPFLPDPPQNDR